jgi:recombinational DNA repair protein RecT
VKVHVGKHTGIDLGELDRESVEALLTKWLPTAIEMEKPLKADREMIAALQQAKEALSSEDEESDEIPF